MECQAAKASHPAFRNPWQEMGRGTLYLRTKPHILTTLLSVWTNPPACRRIDY